MKTTTLDDGFSLLEIAMVLLIIGLLAAAGTGMMVQQLNQQRRETTKARQTSIETAMATYVTQNKRLPCPANGTLATTNASAGFETINGGVTACTLVNQQHGVVPWNTIGISLAEAVDGWGNMFTYRVDASLVVAGSMDLTYCSGAGTAGASGSAPNLTCSTACTTTTFPGSCTPPTSVTTGRGLRVKNKAGTILSNPLASPSTGAAYVVISHGENQLGAYTIDGAILTSGTVASGTEELHNYANLVYDASLVTTYLVDDAPLYPETTAHFDDFVLRPSISNVATKAGIGPRAY